MTAAPFGTATDPSPTFLLPSHGTAPVALCPPFPSRPFLMERGQNPGWVKFRFVQFLLLENLSVEHDVDILALVRGVGS